MTVAMAMATAQAKDVKVVSPNGNLVVTVTDEGGNTVGDGEMTEKGTVTVPGAAGKLYMVEIKAK